MTRKSITLQQHVHQIEVDDDGRVVREWTDTEDLTVWPGHQLYQVFKKPGINQFAPTGHPYHGRVIFTRKVES